MTILHIPSENRSLRQYDEIRDFLAVIDIDYERWEPVAAVTSWEQILDVYSKPINELKRRGGYVTADVIDVIQPASMPC